MNRTFHVKISGTTHLFLILFTLIMLVAFWYKGAALIGMFFAMIVIINIERIIHSTYTLTADGNLVIYNGRFQKEKNIPLSRITDVELKRLFGLKHLRFTRYVLVHYDNDKVIDLLPEKPEEFMNALVRRLEHKEEDEDTLKKICSRKPVILVSFGHTTFKIGKHGTSI